MSLKAIHIFFILCSIALALFLAVWHYQSSSMVLAAVFFVASIGLAGYLVWFIKKMKENKK